MTPALNAMPNKSASIIFYSIVVVGLFGCDHRELKSRDEKLEATQESIQRNLVNRSCVSCHLDATVKNRYVSLVDIGSVIEKPGSSPSGRRYLIKPGCPKESFFLSIIREGKMPPAPAQSISTEEIQVIEEFIRDLNPSATSETCSDEPPDSEEP